MAIRREVTSDEQVRDGYVEGVTALKQENTGLTTETLGIPGFEGTPPQPLSTWDLLAVWHFAAMHALTPPDQPDRNAAHTGPVFLPWHRWMLLVLEANLQRILGAPDFGLPYWNWAADGDRPVEDQPNAPLWSAACMGGNGKSFENRVVVTGPFGVDTDFRVRVAQLGRRRLGAVNRPLQRWFRAIDGASLPTTAEVKSALALLPYDAEPWDSNSQEGFRNRLEGWEPPGSLHNAVHIWVQGDMGSGTSPNDPVFYLNHCNVDRLWASWQAQYGDAPYLPGDDGLEELRGHRPSDPMFGFLTDDVVTPADVLDVSGLYTYDRLGP